MKIFGMECRMPFCILEGKAERMEAVSTTSVHITVKLPNSRPSGLFVARRDSTAGIDYTGIKYIRTQFGNCGKQLK